MLGIPHYLGETQFFHRHENYQRVWHVWAYYEDTGELTSIRYGISINLDCALKAIKRAQCLTPLQQHLWSMAQERLPNRLGFDDTDDDTVIEPFDSNVVPFTRS